MFSIKLVVGQAKYINQYKNLRVKVKKCCASIYFNRQCLKQGIIPKYAHIKVQYTSPASKVMQKKAQIAQVKQEIKYLNKKKDFLNQSLYKTHLQAASEWGKSWELIRGLKMTYK
jgi:protein-arginine kinase activator protein McsA